MDSKKHTAACFWHSDNFCTQPLAHYTHNIVGPWSWGSRCDVTAVCAVSCLCDERLREMNKVHPAPKEKEKYEDISNIQVQQEYIQKEISKMICLPRGEQVHINFFGKRQIIDLMDVRNIKPTRARSPLLHIGLSDFRGNRNHKNIFKMFLPCISG